LAERRADIPQLTAHFLARLGGQRQLRLDSRAQQMLEAYRWPGNVRELQQVLERAAILAEDAPVILAQHLIFSFERGPRLLEKKPC
jgi:DNA-binding NtrC family response regulator